MKCRFGFLMFTLAFIWASARPMDTQAQSVSTFVSKVKITDEVVTFQPREGAYVDFMMTVVGPDGFRLKQHFSGQETPSLRVKGEKGLTLPNGSYKIEMSARPMISDKDRAALDKARQKGDRYEMRKLMKEMGLNPAAMVYRSNLAVVESKFLQPEGEEETVDKDLGVLDEVRSTTPPIQSVQLTGRRWDAAYLPNEPDVTGAVVQPAALAADVSGQAPPFAQAAPDPTAAWYEATFQNTAEDGTPLTYQGFLRPVVTDDQGKLFEVYLRKADGLAYGPWQQGYFQADEGTFRLANHTPAAQPFDYVTDENTDAAEAAMPVWHTGGGSIQGSLCVGNDCPANPAFGFDTIRLQENNLRIHFDDTSVAAAFPNQDWRITINDSANGGSEHFSVGDATAGTTPFRVEAGARTDALVVESDGDIGIGTRNPAVDIDVKTGNTPTLRLQQDGTSGFAPQTWDVAGNEAGFFVRDATNGSTLPLRIRPGAPSSSIDIATDGDVGIGTGSPAAKLHIENTSSNDTDDIVLTSDGRIGIGTTAPTNFLEIEAETPTLRLDESDGPGAGVDKAYTFFLNAGNFQFRDGNTSLLTLFDLTGVNSGQVQVANDLSVLGTLSKSAGSFKIDHPLDPDNKFLYHSFVESPDMMNVYNGNIVLDAQGQAVVELPTYFEALNREFRYQLTPIGGFAPIYIARGIEGNRFVVAGGTPGMTVSWQVTGVRQDPFAETNRIQVEVDKEEARGFYLHPNLYNMPVERSIDYQMNPPVIQQRSDGQ